MFTELHSDWFNNSEEGYSEDESETLCTLFYITYTQYHHMLLVYFIMV